jgi:hypothetical protein
MEGLAMEQTVHWISDLVCGGSWSVSLSSSTASSTVAMLLLQTNPNEMPTILEGLLEYHLYNIH